MKLSTLLLASSLAANATLLGFFAFRPELAPPVFRDYFSRPASPSAARVPGPAATATVGDKRDSAGAASGTLWSQLYAGDLTQFAARLRAAGFSPAIVRALIAADIDSRINRQLDELAHTLDNVPFWKPDPFGSTSGARFTEAANQIRAQKTKLLREALGDDYFGSAAGSPSAGQVRQFGALPDGKVDLIKSINADYDEMTMQLRAIMRNVTLPEDREKLALLDREKHTDLAAILTPDELTNYEMRSSTLTSRLRMPVTVMNASEEEFRAIYAAQQPLAEVLYPTGQTSPEMRQQRTDAQQQVAEALKAVLGDQRYADYVRASNSEYQMLYRQTQGANLPVEAAVQAFNLRDTTSQESTRIYSDQSLNNEQKRAALQALAQNAKAQLQTVLGPTVGNSYASSATWLQAIENGNSVSFGADGQSTMIRLLAPAQK